MREAELSTDIDPAVAQLAAARPDFQAIARWIRPGAQVLDLGCGDGSLLR